MKAGFVTDTHVLPDPESLERVRRAYRFFAEKKVDLIANLGDIAHNHFTEGYRLYAEARSKAYPNPACRPKEIFLWANHDRINFTPGIYASSYADSFAAAKPILGISHEMCDRLTIGGFVFLIFPQCVEMSEYERMIDEAVADCPSRPVFVLHHVPPKGTTDGSESSGDPRLTKILKKYPQVVNFSGHTHGSLRNERLIWQDGFTCVNLGCLSSWQGSFRGRVAASKRSWDCACLEFYLDRLIVRRYSLYDGAEIGAHDPWTIVWGRLDDYCLGRRAAKARRPQFAPDARLTVKVDSDPMRKLVVRIPSANASREILGYRLTIARMQDGYAETLAVRETCGDFYREESVPAQRFFTDEIPASFFDMGVNYRFSVVPYGFFGNEGNQIAAEFTAPALFCDDVLCDLTEGLPTLAGGERWLLPSVIQDLPAKTPLRIVVDAESSRTTDEAMNFRMECFPKKEPLCGWVVCEPGTVRRRYVLDFTRGSGTQPVYLSPTFSPKASRLKLLRVRIERRDSK